MENIHPKGVPGGFSALWAELILRALTIIVAGIASNELTVLLTADTCTWSFALARHAGLVAC